MSYQLLVPLLYCTVGVLYIVVGIFLFYMQGHPPS